MTVSATRLGRLAIALATACVLWFACVSAVDVVGTSNLRPGARAIAFDDHALQFYYGRLGAEFLAAAGVMHGYDPRFMAGYPKSPVYYPSSRPYELALWLFGGLDQARVFNWTVLVLLAACPFLTWAAAWSLGLSAAERLVVAAFTAVPHLLVPMADFYRYMEPSGMESYIFASALSLLVAGLFVHFVWHGGTAAALGLWVAAPLLYFTHPAAVVISAVPIALAYVTGLRGMSLRRHAWLAVVLLTIAVANWPWIEGQILFGHYADLRDFYSTQGRTHFVPKGGLLSPLRGYLPQPAPLALVPPVLGIAGLVLWWRERQRRLLFVVASQILFLFVLSYYGVYLGLSALAPGRITLPLGLWLLLPAAHALVVGLAAVARSARAASGRPAGGIVALGLLGLGAVVAARAAGLGTKVWRWYTFPTIERSEGFERHGVALMQWLGEHTDARGRLLDEETDRNSHQYYGSHLPALIPLYTGLELAGGPAPHALLQQNVLRFEAGTLLGYPLEHVPRDALFRRLALYNVRWVLCWTARAKAYFGRMPGVTTVGSYDKFTLYRVDAEPSYFLEGSGTIEAHENRLVLRDVVPAGGRVAIKYHWLETLRTDPPREIRPLPVEGDPVPFIAVSDPPRELVIYNDYDLGIADWLAGRLEPPAAGG